MARISFARTKKVLNPRKATVGTTFDAKGLISAPPPKTDSELGSSVPVVIREVVPALASGNQRLQTYSKMMNDASVDVSMRAAKMPILGAEFFVEPFSDNPLDIEIAEFISANLFEGMSAPLLNSLEDILHMFEDGYSVLEKVYEMREWAPRRTRSAANTRNFTMLKKLGVRPASTIKEIEYDNNGGPDKIVQNAIQKDKTVAEKDLDIAKVIIFTFSRMGGDLTGKSLLRTAYPHWYYKTHFYKIDAIQKERFSLGVIIGKLLPGYKPLDHTTLQKLLRNYRTNEESFMILPPSVDVSVDFPGGTPVNVLDSASHHNAMILLNVLAQFVGLGMETGGGRATAGTQADLFMKSLRYVANHIADQFNMYLVPELVVWNYPTKNFPKIKVRNMGETRDLQMLGGALSNLFAQNVITWDEDTENWVRQIFDMPRKAAGTTPVPQPTDPSGNGNGSGLKGNVNLKPGDVGFVGKPTSAAQ
jgi:hypothetical protein